MSKTTTNFGLIKPEKSDNYSVDVMGDNMDKIDAELKEHDNVVNGGAVKSSSITNSGTITSTGKITANGGIAGKLEGFLFVKGTVGTSGDDNYATLAAQTWGPGAPSNKDNPGSITINNYSIVYGNPKRHTHGVYTRRSDLTGTLNPSASTRTMVFKQVDYSSYLNYGNVYWRYSGESSWNSLGEIRDGSSVSVTVSVGKTVQFYAKSSTGYGVGVQVTVNAGTTYKVKYATP